MARPRKAGAVGKGEFRLRIHIDPSPVKIAKELGGLGPEFDDWKEALRELPRHLADGLQKVFDQKGRPLDAGIWPADDAAYVKRKARQGFATQQLVRTGRTIADATSATRGVLSLRKNALVFGVKGQHVRAIQFGFRRSVRYTYQTTVKNPSGAYVKKGARKTAARPFIGWSDFMRGKAFEIMNDFARKKLEAISARLNSLGAKAS